VGDSECASEWTERPLLMDPDDKGMRFNLACAVTSAGQIDQATDITEPLFPKVLSEGPRWTGLDPDLESLHNIPRF